MRFNREITPETLRLLKRIQKYSRHHQVRQRAQCIILRNQGLGISQLVKIFGISRQTIHNWFNNWESRGVSGLYNRPGRGRKQTFSEEQKQQIKDWAQENPKNLNTVIEKIKEAWDITVSKDTIKRILKFFGMSWRRMRKIVGGQPDPLEYKAKQEQLNEFKEQDKQGKIDLRYLDESGFCQVPVVPYAWQDKDQTLEIESIGGKKRLNVLGIMNCQNDLHVHTFECRINSDVVAACIDDFCEYRKVNEIKIRSIIVLDQASIHTSDQIVYEKQEEWKEKGVELFWLPTYSPELNLIEIFWRFMKYEWIEVSAYKSWSSLVDYVEKVLNGFGDEYQINFA